MNRICSEVEMASAGGQFGAHSSAVEPPAHNRSVPGSNPGGPTTNKIGRKPNQKRVAMTHAGTGLLSTRPAKTAGFFFVRHGFPWRPKTICCQTSSA